jgi:hypothetical protein
MWTTSNLKPEIQSKPLEHREAFVTAANAALKKGRTLSEAEFAGEAALAALLKAKARSSQTLLNEEVKLRQPPPHLAAILKAAEIKKKALVEKVEEPQPVEVRPTVVELHFDREGYLIVKFSDGKIVRSKNAVKKDEQITQNLTVHAASSQGGGIGTSEFSTESELSRQYYYDSSENLIRIEYVSGNFKTFEYNSITGLLSIENYIKGSTNYRKTYLYDSAQRLIEIIYEVVVYTPPVFTGFFIPQYSEPQSLVFSGNFTSQYSEPETLVFDGLLGPQYS